MKNSLDRCAARLLLAAILSAGALSAARATVLLELAGGYLKDSSGAAIVSGAGMFLLVASTSDAVFSAVSSSSSFSVGELLNADTDDYVLFRASVSGDGYIDGVETAGEFRQAISLSLTSTIAEGSALQLYWFPTLNPSSTSAAAGISYGTYRSGIAAGLNDADGSAAWVLPTDGTSGWSLLFLTSDAGSSVNTATSGISAGLAVDQVVAVPEPALWGMLAIGLAILASHGWLEFGTPASLPGRRPRKKRIHARLGSIFLNAASFL